MRKDPVVLSVVCFIILLHSPSGDSVDSPLAPALYVFGDSLLDSGNNNLLPTLSRANYPPYGVNFSKGRATGRFTNGRTVADFLAEFLGLPLPPPYLSFRRSDRSKGLNYASATCGILPETGSALGKCLNMEDQIKLFEQTVEMELPGVFPTSEKLSDHLSKSIFGVSMGSNDYISYVQSTSPFDDKSKRYSPQSFAHLLVDNLSHKLERLYELGARKVVVFEIGPIGCMPSVTRKFAHSGKCVEQVNKLVALFNSQLAVMLRQVASSLPGSAFILGRINSLAYDAIVNPSHYGLMDSSNPCCITWANGTSACIPLSPPCQNANQHFFYDGYHPTEAVYSVMADRCIRGSSVCVPMNMKDLVRSI